MKILVVDDEKIILQGIVRLLKSNPLVDDVYLSLIHIFFPVFSPAAEQKTDLCLEYTENWWKCTGS